MGTWKEKMGERSESLQALRGISFLGIFLTHAGVKYEWDIWFVSVFYVLSGFLLYYRYGNRHMDTGIRRSLAFSWKRIRKLYPLHILMMCIAVILEFLRFGTDLLSLGERKWLAYQIALNVTLLQTWVPDSNINVCLNGVAWFLSVIAFLYVMFPWIAGRVRKRSMKSLLMICLGILFLQVAACVPMVFLLGHDSPVYVWFMYCFPIFRLGDFYAGCCLGKYILESEVTEAGLGKGTAREAFFLILTLLVFRWADCRFWHVVDTAMHNWTTVWIPVSVLWIWLFLKKEGLITRVLTNKLLIFLGDISPQGFLIHFMVIRYINLGLERMGLSVSGVGRVLLILGELALSVALSVLYKRLESRLWKQK